MLFKTLLTSDFSVKRIVEEVQHSMFPKENNLPLRNLSCMLDNKKSNLFKLTNKGLEYKEVLPFGCINMVWIKIPAFKQ